MGIWIDMSAKMAQDDVADVLTSSGGGDVLRLTVEADGDEKTITAEVIEAFYHEPEKDGFGWSDGMLDMNLEVGDDEFERLDLPTYSIDILATETRPGEWDGFSMTVWDPEVDDEGMVQRDDWTSLGSVVGAERVEE